MSVNEVLARVGEIRARMELAPMRALAPMPAAVATARTGQAPDASFQATLENVQNQALAGTVPVAPTNPLSFYPGAGYLAHDPDLGTKMATQAVQYVGTPYVAGGNSPSTGWDCAAMTEWVAEQHGVKIPPVSWTLILHCKKGFIMEMAEYTTKLGIGGQWNNSMKARTWPKKWNHLNCKS